MNEITIPANYDVWLTDLKHYLDRGRGRKAELARHLVASREMKLPSARVMVSLLLGNRYMPGADLFLDVAAWLQQQQDGQGDVARLERADEPEPSARAVR